MDIPCWGELVQYGAMEIIQREYGQYVTDTEQDYAISLQIDVETVPEIGGALLR
jgi:actin related protein 2/3 complex subunit 2